MRAALSALVALVLVPLAPAAAEDLPAVPSDWQSPLARDHPLVGTLWHVPERRKVTPAELAEAAADADYVLLGETHDNPDHHRIQAWTISALTARGRRPAVAFEMIDEDQSQALRDHLDAHPNDASGLGPAIGWETRGWPSWSTYRPIAEAALAAGLPLRAADVARDTQRDVGKRGYDALTPERRDRLGLDTPLPRAIHDALRVELMRSHCDMLPESALEPMVRVQRLRDAVMADSLIAASERSESGQAVLITGRGHARADRGVPWYLRQRLDAPAVLTVGIFEVADGERDWRRYLPDGPESGGTPFDFVWFTPRIDDKDHCAELRERMQRSAGHGSTQEN